VPRLPQQQIPIAKLTGEIISTAKAPTLKSNPTVPQSSRAGRGDAYAGDLHAGWNFAKRGGCERHGE